jgi:hypothetical protein
MLTPSTIILNRGQYEGVWFLRNTNHGTIGMWLATKDKDSNYPVKVCFVTSNDKEQDIKWLALPDNNTSLKRHIQEMFEDSMDDTARHDNLLSLYWLISGFIIGKKGALSFIE